MWNSGPSTLAGITLPVIALSRVAVREQAGGGNNLSIGLTSMAYHLKVLSSVEECVLAREGAVAAAVAEVAERQQGRAC
ncbi:hypothetical protein GCM10023084_61990 [Streptomyces lacrimifluminis]|uniref:Uncharacterized protein n=1 Tax=Streptomyces lacrimifluminis TaxID=1500077 RepID=A0A917L6J8_9ACTN|nr:hypothetical protein GCM10012282_46830 [Streptomyces lacrimifluminis]